MFDYFICGAILTVIIDTKDVEKDGLHTHLLKTTYVPQTECPDKKLVMSSNNSPVFISYNSYKPLGKEGDVLRIQMDGDCSSGRSVDEEASDRLNQWVSYTVWICNANELKVLRGPQ